jgi:hypothetical protein
MSKVFWFALLLLLASACVYRHPPVAKSKAPTTDGLRVVLTPASSVDTNSPRR